MNRHLNWYLLFVIRFYLNKYWNVLLTMSYKTNSNPNCVVHPDARQLPHCTTSYKFVTIFSSFSEFWQWNPIFYVEINFNAMSI